MFSGLAFHGHRTIFPVMSPLSLRTRPGFIEPCLPSPADKPPLGANWIYEIKQTAIA